MDYPFSYFGHGLGSPTANFYAYIWFEKTFDESEKENFREFIKDSTLYHLFQPQKDWHGPHLMFFFEGYSFNEFIKHNPEYDEKEFPDILPDDLFKFYGIEKKGLPDVKKKLLAFNHQLDETLKQIHQVYPIRFFLNCQSNRTQFSPWHKWSLNQFKNSILPYLLSYFKDYQTTVFDATNRFNLKKSPIVFAKLLDFYLKAPILKKMSHQEKEELFQTIIHSTPENYFNTFSETFLKLKDNSWKNILGATNKSYKERMFIVNFKFRNNIPSYIHNYKGIKLSDEDFKWLENELKEDVIQLKEKILREYRGN